MNSTMWKRLMPNRPTIIPNLVLAQHVIDKIALAASRYVEDETGEALIGLVKPGEGSGVPTVYVLETIAPDESAIREAHTFQQGDEAQDEMLWWYYRNWDARREKQRAANKADPWDFPLQHLGDWHRQPGHMIAPSGGDLMTALDMLEDDASRFDFLLAPIVTLYHPPTISTGTHVNYLTAPQDDGSYLRIDFWYIDRTARPFAPITPTVYPDDKLPSLVAYPWHLKNDDRFRTELAQLNGDGLFTSVLTWDTDGKLPLEICFIMGRQGGRKMLIIATPHDYPHAAPTAYLAPFLTLGKNEVMYDLMSRVWDQARHVDDLPGWKWSSDTYLIDYIRALETHLGMAPAQPVHAPVPNPETEPSTEGDDDVGSS